MSSSARGSHRRGRADRVLRELADEPRAVQATACGHSSIALSLENLMSFPWIRERVQAGSLTLHGWYFDINTGELLAYSPQTSKFEPLVPAPAAASADRNGVRSGE